MLDALWKVTITLAAMPLAFIALVSVYGVCSFYVEKLLKKLGR